MAESRHSNQYYYTRDHIWFRFTARRIVILGLSPYAIETFGELSFVDFAEESKDYQAGDILAVLESSKIATDVYFPLAGTLLHCNQAVLEQISLLNNSPMHEGWLAELRIAENTDLSAFLSSEDYHAYIGAS